MRLGSDNNCCSAVYVASLELQCLSLTMTTPRVVVSLSGGYYKLTCNTCIKQQPCRHNEYHVHAFDEAKWHTGSIVLTALGDAAEVHIYSDIFRGAGERNRGCKRMYRYC